MSENSNYSLIIPPVPNTDNKVSDNIHTRAVTEDGALASGVVDSVGEALFINDDIPPIFAESGIFSKAE